MKKSIFTAVTTVSFNPEWIHPLTGMPTEINVDHLALKPGNTVYGVFIGTEGVAKKFSIERRENDAQGRPRFIGRFPLANGERLHVTENRMIVFSPTGAVVRTSQRLRDVAGRSVWRVISESKMVKALITDAVCDERNDLPRFVAEQWMAMGYNELFVNSWRAAAERFYRETYSKPDVLDMTDWVVFDCRVLLKLQLPTTVKSPNMTLREATQLADEIVDGMKQVFQNTRKREVVTL